MDKDVNSAAPVVPKTQYVPGTPTPNGTEPKPAPVDDPPAVTFNANNPVGITGAGQGCSGDASAACAEPSGASGGGVILVDVLESHAKPVWEMHWPGLSRSLYW